MKFKVDTHKEWPVPLIADFSPTWIAERAYIEKKDMNVVGHHWFGFISSNLMLSHNESIVRHPKEVLVGCIIDQINLNIGELVRKEEGKSRRPGVPDALSSCSIPRFRQDQKGRASGSKSQGITSGNRTYPTCPKYGKNHLGECLAGKKGCFGCGQSGHSLLCHNSDKIFLSSKFIGKSSVKSISKSLVLGTCVACVSHAKLCGVVITIFI
ncbi:hypothetical protein R3W88_029513 [Solanum pinnatisectum]|uniref:Putative plant transposon protein domain-containing protein n=1 Tax=Solanum pinnatisectum TaxID=50273 RepID=A0AAV9K5Z0_9SOLN|nr:hypothetical protein R3W88_029513 [Solanum pinnatisectum]